MADGKIKNLQIETNKKQSTLSRKKKRNGFWLPDDEVSFDW